MAEKGRKNQKYPKNGNSPFSFSGEGSILVYRRNAVAECVRSGNAKILYADEKHRDDPIVLEAQQKGIKVSVISSDQLSSIAMKGPHQGLVCVCDRIETMPLADLIRFSSAQEHPLILVLDGIEDPQNLGAILRSCDAFRVDGVLMKSTGNAPINSTVSNVSTGAVFYVNVCVVPNLSQAISELKDAGFWIASAEGSASMSYTDLDYDRSLALVIGSEGFGISKTVLKHSDYIVKVPMQGHVNSLNASVATGVMLAYARSKQWK